MYINKERNKVVQYYSILNFNKWLHLQLGAFSGNFLVSPASSPNTQRQQQANVRLWLYTCSQWNGHIYSTQYLSLIYCSKPYQSFSKQTLKLTSSITMMQNIISNTHTSYNQNTTYICSAWQAACAVVHESKKQSMSLASSSLYNFLSCPIV